MLYTCDLTMQRRKLQAQQRKAAMIVHKPKAAPIVRMEELRALNMLKLDPDDAKARTELAQKPRGIIPSGLAVSLSMEYFDHHCIAQQAKLTQKQQIL